MKNRRLFIFTFFVILLFLNSLLCEGQDNSNMRNSIGLQVALNDFAPFISYDIDFSDSDLRLNSSICVIYDWKADILLFPVSMNIKYGRKLNVFAGIGVGNYIDFTPFPSSRMEQDNWIPTGGQWISYPFNIRPNFQLGFEYEFDRISLSLSTLNIIYWYRQYDIPDPYLIPKNSIKPIILSGIKYKF